MNNPDFWQAIYLASIASGKDNDQAAGVADRALQHFEDRIDYWEALYGEDDGET